MDGSGQSIIFTLHGLDPEWDRDPVLGISSDPSRQHESGGLGLLIIFRRLPLRVHKEASPIENTSASHRDQPGRRARADDAKLNGSVAGDLHPRSFLQCPSEKLGSHRARTGTSK